MIFLIGPVSLIQQDLFLDNPVLFPILILRPILFRSCPVKTAAHSSLSTLCPGCQLTRQAALTRGGHSGCLSWGYSRGGDGSADSLTPAGARRGWKGGRLAAIYNMSMCVHLAGSYQGLALPDDRYEGGGERVRRQKHRNTRLCTKTHLDLFDHVEGQ